MWGGGGAGGEWAGAALTALAPSPFPPSGDPPPLTPQPLAAQVRHYAGAVQYDNTGLLDKCKDTLSAGRA